MSAVVWEADPASEGWIELPDGSWQTPDGNLYVFPPGQPPKILHFRRIYKDEIVYLSGERLERPVPPEP